MLGFWMDGKLLHSMLVETKPSGLVYFDPYSEEQMRLCPPGRRSRVSRRLRQRRFRQGPCAKDAYDRKKNKFLDSITFVGPLCSARPNRPAAQKILICDPNSGPACVDQDRHQSGASRAGAGPSPGRSRRRCTKFVAMAKANGQNTEQGIQLALQAMLVSPAFPFPRRARPEPPRPAKVHPHHRSRTGLAPELFPVEFDAGRRTARARRGGQTARIRPCSMRR